MKMSNGAKKIGLYAGIGILIAIILISSIGLSGLKFPSLQFPDFFHPPATTGNLTIKVTDKPVNLTKLYLTIDSISAHKEQDDNETWINLAFVNSTSEVTFDLLKLQNITMDLSVTEIPPGNYTQLRMHVRAANATYANSEVETLNVPSEHLKILIHFRIDVGQGTTLLIDIEPDWIHISQSGNFRPVTKATVVT